MGFFLTLMNRSRRVIDRTFWVLVLISGVAIVTMMGATVYEVVARYVFNRPTSWSVEVSTYVIVAPVFLAAAYTLMNDGHVNVQLVIELFSRKTQLITHIVTSFVSLLFLVVLAWNISGLFFQAYADNTHSPGIMQIPLSPVYFVMAVGSIMFCLAMVVKIIDYFLALGAREEKG